MAVLTSSVWGGTSKNINSAHLAHAWWDAGVKRCGGVQGVSGCCGAGCCDWYTYAWSYGVSNVTCVHPGVDIGVLKHTPLYAARAGRIKLFPNSSAYRPHFVTIESPNDGGAEWRDLYGHMWTIAPGLLSNQLVSAGRLIGTSGEQTLIGTMTPDGSGPHLHFESTYVSAGTLTGRRFLDPVPILVSGQAGDVPPPPVGGYAVTDKIRAVSSVNLRSSPSLTGGILASVPVNGEMCVLSATSVPSGGYTWWQVKYLTFTGWVAGSFTSLVTALGCSTVVTTTPAPPGAFAVGDRVAASSSLNMRAGAGTGFAILGSVPIGGLCCLLAGPTSGNGYTWWKVRYGTADGYIINAFTLSAALFCLSTTTTAPPSTGSLVIGDLARATSSLNLRATASPTATLLQTIPLNGQVCIIGGAQVASGFTWYKVTYLGVTGFVISNLALVTSQGCATGWAIGNTLKCIAASNIRSGAGTNFGIVGTVAVNTNVVLQSTSYPPASGYVWCQVKQGASLIGWVVKANFVKA